MYQPELTLATDPVLDAIECCAMNQEEPGGWPKFRQYHLDHPEIWPLFEQFTLQVIATSRDHYGSMDIVGRIRWYSNIEKKGSFKVSNTAHPYYARLFMQLHPEHNGFFRTQDKPLRGDVSRGVNDGT